MLKRIFQFAIVVVIFTPTLLRATMVSGMVYTATGQDSDAFIEVLRSDAPLIGVIIALLILTATIRSWFVAVIPFLGAAALQLALFADVVVYDQFYQRLAYLDVVKFYDYALKYIAAFDIVRLSIMFTAGAIFVGMTYFVFRTVHALNLKPTTAVAPLFVVGLVSFLAWHSRDIEYVHYRFYQNFISYNEVIASEAVGYSDGYIAASFDPLTAVCTPTPTVSGPVIIYMVESLSSYQSEFFSGVNDWTPRLDDLARNNAALSNFYANGYTTEDGLLSLVTAENAIYPPNSYSDGGNAAFGGHWSPSRSLAQMFNGLGYDSYFITTSDLSFSSTGEWVASVGFETIQGSTDPFYDGMERFHFDAAPDAALVANILETYDGSQATPFVFAKSVSGHHPHIHPETGERSVEAVVRYADEQVGALYDGLNDRGFFENGTLVVVGDHRAMLSITRGEVELFGLDKAYTQVPAVVISPQTVSAPINITDGFAQSDLSNTLFSMFGGEACTTPFQGIFLGDGAQSPDFVLHRRGDRRNQISVFANDRLGVVTLRGDDTAFTGDDFTAQEQDKVVEFINNARISAGLARQSRATND